MKYGCIGEHMKHSFSKEIHNALADYSYEIMEVAKNELDNFAEKKDFSAINVTIPYKEMIIPHLYYIDEHAKMIGAVNTVVNKSGKLYGYNTDFFGMVKLLEHAKVDVKEKTVAILGTGGTSKTAYAVVKHLGAKKIFIVSRTDNYDVITYDELYSNSKEIQIIINTTPVGMFPNCEKAPLNLDKFPNVSGVIDAVYNPLRTVLISQAKKKNIHAEGGLYMLVAQAVKASEKFIETEYPDEETERVYKKILKEKENIVLVGMPGCGKTTISSILEKQTGFSSLDTDNIIENRLKTKIKDIIKEQGEEKFRDEESDTVIEVSKLTGKIIATGGGVVLRNSNISALKRNGKIYFIDRPLKDLLPTSDRPLSSTKEDLKKRYFERYEIYNSVCDVHIDGTGTADEVANRILKEFFK